MMEHNPPRIILQSTRFLLPQKLMMVIGSALLIGTISVVAGLQIDANGWSRLRLGYLVAFSFVLSLSLGSMFFVLLQHLVRAGWSVLIRRPAEVFAMNIVTVGILAIPLAWFVSQGELYPWANPQNKVEHLSTTTRDKPTNDGVDPEEIKLKEIEFRSDLRMADPAISHKKYADSQIKKQSLYAHQVYDELTQSKSGWLNRSSFLFRMAVYFAIWFVITGYYYFKSRKQDRMNDGQVATRQMEWLAGPMAIGFALSLTFAAFDWLMSLDPHWYSTMFGVYFFAGCVVGGLSINLLTLIWSQRQGNQLLPLSVEHQRDLGRLLFAFVFFWGYIAFSQYMLLWYANLPETTRWFVNRGASMASGYTNSWGWLLLVLLFGHFLIPFLGIMSRHVKSNQRAMAFWTCWLLAMHYLDLYWLVMPELGPGFTISLIETGVGLVVVGIWLTGAAMIATGTNTIPVNDPRLPESIRLQDAY